MTTKTLIQTLETVGINEIYEGGHSGNLKVKEFHGIPRFKAYTHMVTKDISEKFNPEYEEKNPGESAEVARDVTRHEINHHRYNGCIGVPQTLEKHVEFFYEPMSEVLNSKSFSSEDISYATNALEDTLLHYDLNKGRKFSLNGIVKFFNEVGISSKKDEKGKFKFTPFYEAHVKLNMHLWGNKQQKKVMQKFYTHDKKITEALTNFIKKTKDYNPLEEKNWKEISKIYAEEFSKLMEPGYAQPIFNHSGKGTKGNEQENGNDEDSDDEELGEGNVFDRQMKTKDFKKSRVRKAHNLGEEVPDWINNYEAMDLLYESLAQRLDIKAKTYTESESMPIVWYGKRDFNPQKDNLKKITFGFNEEGNFGLKKKRFHEDIPIQIKTKPESFPRMRFGMLDTSGSMERNVYGGEEVGKRQIIPWGDKSKYHFALLGWYGFLEYLKSNHLLSQNSVDLANFSNSTIVGKGLADAKKVALMPQFSSTILDKNKIKHFFEGEDNLIFTISDGGIENWDSIKSDFIKNAKKHQYFHLQIGEENSTTEDLKEAGFYVEKVMGNEDLARKTIDLTDRLLRREQK